MRSLTVLGFVFKSASFTDEGEAKALELLRILAAHERWFFGFLSASAVETAKANGLKLFVYLKFLLESLPAGCSPQNCLPWLPLAHNLR